MTYFLIWVIIASVHLLFYLHLENDATLQIDKGFFINGYMDTILLLMLFQILRFANLKIQHQELVVPSKAGKKDIYDERNVNFLDVLSLLIYFGCMAALLFYQF
nr:hypothetical protein [uncultured Mucilaginibacter sp.]